MLEWFSAHPVITIILVLLLTSRLWLGPVIVFVGLFGVAAWGLIGVILYILYKVVCVLEWIDHRIRRLLRRRRH